LRPVEPKKEIEAARLAIERAILALQRPKVGEPDYASMVAAKTLIEGALELLQEAGEELVSLEK
jgi:hypothetical protein